MRPTHHEECHMGQNRIQFVPAIPIGLAPVVTGHYRLSSRAGNISALANAASALGGQQQADQTETQVQQEAFAQQGSEGLRRGRYTGRDEESRPPRQGKGSVTCECSRRSRFQKGIQPDKNVFVVRGNRRQEPEGRNSQ
jgi:hypothetical protein